MSLSSQTIKDEKQQPESLRHLFVFEGEGQIKDLLGNYTIFRKEFQKTSKTQKVKKAEVVIEIKPSISDEKKKLSYKEQSEFDGLESKMSALEIEKASLSEKLSDPSLSNEELMKAGERLSVVVSELEAKMDRWLELSEFA